MGIRATIQKELVLKTVWLMQGVLPYANSAFSQKGELKFGNDSFGLRGSYSPVCCNGYRLFG